MFTTALTNVLVMLIFMAPGFILKKAGKVDETHLKTLSSVLIYVGTPFLEISSFMRIPYSTDTLLIMGEVAGLSFLLQLVFLGVLTLIFRKKYDDVKTRVMAVGSVVGNLGFFGLPIVKALFPDYPIVSSFSAIYMFTMNVIVFTFGVYCLTGEKKYISLKSALLNPTTVGFCFALPFFFFGLIDYLPTAFVGAIDSLANMTTPLCMIILGVRLASVPLKNVFTEPKAYFTVAMKLLVYPLFAFAVLYFLPLTYEVKAGLVILSGTPCAAVVLNLAEIYESDKTLPSNCVFLSTILCFLTLPLLTLLF